MRGEGGQARHLVVQEGRLAAQLVQDLRHVAIDLGQALPGPQKVRQMLVHLDDLLGGGAGGLGVGVGHGWIVSEMTKRGKQRSADEARTGSLV